MDYSVLARQHYQLTNEILEATLSDHECLQALTKSYSFVSDIAACSVAIRDRRENKIFDIALKEYQFSLLSLSQGLYRHAFSALRLSFELCLSAIEFSSNELALRKWEAGNNDLNWTRLVNNDTGIFSTNFLRAFKDIVETRGAHFRAIAEKVYRECSEYVHGNPSSYAELPENHSFSKPVVLSWCEKASAIHMVVIYSFYMRYLDDMDEATKKSIEPPFIEVLGHIQEVRTTFGAVL